MLMLSMSERGVAVAANEWALTTSGAKGKSWCRSCCAILHWIEDWIQSHVGPGRRTTSALSPVVQGLCEAFRLLCLCVIAPLATVVSLKTAK